MDGATLRGLLIADTVTVNMGLALMLGSLAAGAWVRHAVSPWAVDTQRQSGTWFRVATALTIAATGAGLWLRSSVVADVSLTDAWPATVTMATATHAGHAWAAGVLALVVAGMAGGSTRVRHRHWLATCLAAVGIAVFAYTRSIVSHAGSQGDFGAAVWVDCGHLVLGCTWAGIAVVAGYAVLPEPTPEGIDANDAAAWVSALSTTAAWALAAIVLTGLFNVWRGAGPLDRLSGSIYGVTLFIKLALVLFAALLGAWNRFRVMPMLLTDFAAGVGTLSRHKRTFIRVLKVEAAVLTGALVAAAFLSASEPPDAAAISSQSKSAREKT